mmetsp:Transcript_87470/g.271707  ORF Transcript_87470/g.271707 Transcript_87470/m.271707 type:complete len:393 (-) Transcript_87470:143-1321(-)
MVCYTSRTVAAGGDWKMPWAEVCDAAPGADCRGDEANSRSLQAAHAADAAAGEERPGWQQGRLSASALRRQRRQRATSLAAKLAAMEKQGARAGEGQAPAKPPVRSGRATGNAKGGGKAVHCAKLVEGLEVGGKARVSAVAALRGCVVPLAFDAAGCRAVQLALHVADRRSATELAGELRGHVCEAIRSPHANYVIQKVIEAMPVTLSSFVAEELRGVGPAVARHRYGCRVLCRLLEHTSSSASLAEVINELLAETADLCRHSFGHHVMESLLEHGHLVQQQQVVAVLREDLLSHAQHRCASHVVEAALAHCSAADQAAVAGDLLHEDKMVSLAQNQFGSFVAKALLMLPGGTRAAAWGHLQQGAARLKETKPGQRLLRDLGLGSVAAAAAP